MLTHFTNAKIPCIHCKRTLFAEDLQITIFLYGIPLLEGKDDGYIGLTCPSCLLITFVHVEKTTFDQIVQSFNSIVFFCDLQVKQQLKYFSPYSTPAEQNNLLRFSTTFTDDTETETIEEEIFLFEDENFGENERYYRTYINGLAPPVGPFFYNLWLSQEQIHDFITKEVQTGIKFFPRYIQKFNLLEIVEDFCWKHCLEEAFLDDSKKKIEETLKTIPPEIQTDEVGHISSPELFNIAIAQKHEQDNKDVSLTSVLHEIIVDNPPPWDFPSYDNKMQTLWKTLYPFREIEDLKPLYEVKIEDKEAEQDFEKKSKKLQQCFQKDFSQKFLRETADDFINDYIKTVYQVGWSYADLWRLKKLYINRYYSAVRIGLRDEANYAFYKQGEAWKITFDGKPITGLKQNGFKYIHFLVCHENESFLHTELNEMDYGAAANGKQFTNEHLNIDGTDTFELIDKQGSQEIKAEIQRLREEHQKALSLDEHEYALQLEKELEELEAYYSETHSRVGKIKIERGNYKKIQTRIGNAIKRAINLLEQKDYKEVAQHFKKSIKGIYGNKIFYTSVDNKITWFT